MSMPSSSAQMLALRASRVRPGCGFYSDDAPRQLLPKVVDVGRLVRDCPPCVTNVQYELENWPYITLDKAVATVIHECTASLIMGCTGVAFNALSECATDFAEYDPVAEAVAAHRPVWQGLLDAACGLAPRGFWPAGHLPAKVARHRVIRSRNPNSLPPGAVLLRIVPDLELSA